MRMLRCCLIALLAAPSAPALPEEKPDKALEKLGARIRYIASRTYVDLAGVTDAARALDLVNGLDADLLHLKATGPAVTDAALKALKADTRLLELDLTDAPVTDGCLKALKGIAFLRELRLAGTKVTAEGVAGLKGMKNLRSLDLSRTGVKGKWWDGEGAFPGLSNLSAAGCSLTDADVAYLAGLPGLNFLTLDDNPKITDEGLAGLKPLGQLLRLGLAGTSVTGPGLKHLAGHRRLGHLDLARSKITDAGLADLAALKQVTSLSLSGTAVTLADAPDLSHLRHLYLIDTKVGDNGARRVAAIAGLVSEHVNLSTFVQAISPSTAGAASS